MKLLTKEIEKKLPPLRSTDGQAGLVRKVDSDKYFVREVYVE